MDGKKLYREMLSKRREEREAGILKSGRKNAFEAGYVFGGIITMFGGLAKIPMDYMKTFQPPKTKKARAKWDLGIFYGRRDSK